MHQTGEIKEVSEGYARNYLLPRKLAIPATPEAIRQAEIKRNKYQAEQKKKQITEEEQLNSLKDKKITLAVKANAEGKLFAAVGPQQIKDALAEQFKIDLPLKYFKITEPIKNTGPQQIEIAPQVGPARKLSVLISAQ